MTARPPRNRSFTPCFAAASCSPGDSVCVRSNVDGGLVRRELDRVLQQVVDDLRKSLGVGAYQDALRRFSEARPTARADGSAPARSTDRRTSATRSSIWKSGSSPASMRDRSSSLRQHRRQTLSALEIDLEQLALLRRQRTGDAVEQRADRLLHRRQRRLEVVRDLRDEIALHAIELVEPLGHRVEVARDLRELVRRRSRRADGRTVPPTPRACRRRAGAAAR